MTLRKKTQVVVAVTLLVLLFLMDIIFTNLLRTTAAQTDKERMLLNLSRTAVSINGETNTLSALADTMAFSDAAYSFMKGENPDYQKSVLNRDALTYIGVSSIIMVDKEHNVKVFKDYSPPDLPSTPQSEFSIIFSTPDDLDMLDSLDAEGKTGIALRGNEPIYFSVKPILTSNIEGPSVGYLLVTMPLNFNILHKISRNLSFAFAIEPIADEDKAAKDLPLTKIRNVEKQSHNIVGHMLVRDHEGKPCFWIRGIAQKEDTRAIEIKLQIIFAVLAVGALLLSVMFDEIFKNIFSKRMIRLKEELENVREESGRRDVITVDGSNDELTSVQRVFNETLAYSDYKRSKQKTLDDLTRMVYDRFAKAESKMYLKTLEGLVCTITPGDEKFRNAIPRAAKMTERFSLRLGVCGEDTAFSHMGALFARIGLLEIPTSIRGRNVDLSPADQVEYKKYPLASQNILNSVESLRPSVTIPLYWNENWDGTGFPKGLSGNKIPLSARVYAIVDAWNEMTRPWLGRKIPSAYEIEDNLRALAGSKLILIWWRNSCVCLEKRTRLSCSLPII